MNRVQRFTDQSKTEVVWHFECPGCGIGHSFRTESKSGKPCWAFNGDPVNPTFNPSLLVDWRSSEGGGLCHSYVRNGRIEFLNDCTHSLAGKTIALALIEDETT